jgi:fructan beta-fructosidase
MMLSSDPVRERARPRLHFSAPSGWLNDPNGLVWHAGEYHLFYQHHPHSLEWGPMHWGHAVSRDLLSWETLPVALEPDALGDIWSGSVVHDAHNTSGLVSGGGLVAVYSYRSQSQGVAFSTDHGRTWAKYAGNPVIASPGSAFRDPKVFWYQPPDEGAGYWAMAIAHGDRACFFRSSDLRTWHETGQFAPADTDGVWECPDLFPIAHGDRTVWVLLVSFSTGAPAGGTGTRCYLGHFDGAAFTPHHPPVWLDHGPDNYAGVTFNHTPDDARILIGWMNNWRYAAHTPAAGWRGMMTVPRVLGLAQVPGAGLRLTQQPIAGLHARRVALDAGDLAGFAAFEAAASWTMGAQPRTLTLDHGGGQATHLRFDGETIVLDRRASGDVAFFDSFACEIHAPVTPIDGRVEVRVIIDTASVEVFAAGGTAVLTAQIFPSRPLTRVLGADHVWGIG